MIRVRQIMLLATALAAAGCSNRPHAPALLAESVYQNDQAGFRLEIPSGWILHTKTALPSGQPVPQEKVLVGYKLTHGAKPASFEIGCMDAPENLDLVAHFTANRTGPGSWRSMGPEQSISAGGVTARRLNFQQGDGPSALRKEVAAVHRGGRFYFFTLVADADDTDALNEARRAVASLNWKDGS